MSDTDIMPAPEFSPIRTPDSKWQIEFDAFQRMLPSLLTTHPGKHVAIHNGRVVGYGDDQIDVAMRAYAQFGYVPIQVGLATTEPRRMVRVPSPLRSSAHE